MNYNEAELCKDCKMPVEKRRFRIKFFNLGGGWSAANTLREVHGDYEEVAFITYRGNIRRWEIPKRQLDPRSRRKIIEFARRVKEGKAPGDMFDEMAEHYGEHGLPFKVNR